jgi:hypothetical protein
MVSFPACIASVCSNGCYSFLSILLVGPRSGGRVVSVKRGPGNLLFYISFRYKSKMLH